jgi:hypothetical protein
VLALLAIALLGCLLIWLGIHLFRAIRPILSIYGWDIVIVLIVLMAATSIPIAVKKLLRWRAVKREMETAAISDRARAYFEGLSASGKK